jgi:hypothetical protein
MLLVSIHCPVSNVHALSTTFQCSYPHSSPVSFDPWWLTRFIHVSKINPLVSSATFSSYKRQSPHLLICRIVEEKYKGIKPKPLEKDYEKFNMIHTHSLLAAVASEQPTLYPASTPSCLLYNLVILNRKNRQFGQKPKKLKISEKCHHRET